VSGIVVGRARLVALAASFGAGAAVAAGRLLRLIPGGRATRETEALDGALDQLVRLGVGGDVCGAGQEDERGESLEVHLDGREGLKSKEYSRVEALTRCDLAGREREPQTGFRGGEAVKRVSE
jgi:hypothetical protein